MFAECEQLKENWLVQHLVIDAKTPWLLKQKKLMILRIGPTHTSQQGYQTLKEVSSHCKIAWSPRQR
ncbi:MAG: hypothetical protein KatS3mg114_1259 [Planctomycetaceae bacterium]|nr:MAG: hypothetical protein KatS3mg114_1259 [Planctomycetaceae bacterium]